LIMAARPRAVIFDLDGTLVHSSPDMAHHLSVALAEVFGGSSTLDIGDIELLAAGGLLDVIGTGIAAMGLTPTPEEVNTVLERYRASYHAEPVINSALYDGVIATLDDLRDRGIGIGLCTNKPEATARGVLDHFGIKGRFGAIIGCDTAATRKPDAGPLLEACRQLGAGTADAVMVGDGKTDLRTARNAGVKIVLVDWGYTSADVATLGADLLISSYADFAKKVKRVFS
jgi:phosphoglycolate phosphatase